MNIAQKLWAAEQAAVAAAKKVGRVVETVASTVATEVKKAGPVATVIEDAAEAVLPPGVAGVIQGIKTTLADLTGHFLALKTDVSNLSDSHDLANQAHVLLTSRVEATERELAAVVSKLTTVVPAPKASE